MCDFLCDLIVLQLPGQEGIHDSIQPSPIKNRTRKAAFAYIPLADQIVELGVGAILVGGFELYGIQMIINATGLRRVVQTMFTTVLVILIVVADIYVFLGAARSAKTGK
ncbi:hypothetical protein METP3_00280 [Methanosarcinales archaeon]|nr:hypothetical protein METP3_00280 [Methanosarcinales archaeon]